MECVPAHEMISQRFEERLDFSSPGKKRGRGRPSPINCSKRHRNNAGDCRATVQCLATRTMNEFFPSQSALRRCSINFTGGASHYVFQGEADDKENLQCSPTKKAKVYPGTEIRSLWGLQHRYKCDSEVGTYITVGKAIQDAPEVLRFRPPLGDLNIVKSSPFIEKKSRPHVKSLQDKSAAINASLHEIQYNRDDSDDSDNEFETGDTEDYEIDCGEESVGWEEVRRKLAFSEFDDEGQGMKEGLLRDFVTFFPREDTQLPESSLKEATGSSGDADVHTQDNQDSGAHKDCRMAVGGYLAETFVKLSCQNSSSKERLGSRQEEAESDYSDSEESDEDDESEEDEGQRQPNGLRKHPERSENMDEEESEDDRGDGNDEQSSDDGDDKEDKEDEDEEGREEDDDEDPDKDDISEAAEETEDDEDEESEDEDEDDGEDNEVLQATSKPGLEQPAMATSVNAKTVNSINSEQDPKKIYVGGMPYYTTEEDVHSYFAECGTIAEVDFATFPDTGRFRGIAFITFKTATAAKKALAYDGSDMGGRYLKITPCRAKPSPSQSSKQQASFDAPPSKTQGCLTAYIANLSWDIEEVTLRDFFKDCNVKAIRFLEDKETGEFKGRGHVDFEDDESLEKAIAMDQQRVLGRPIKVSYAVVRKHAGGGGSNSRGGGGSSGGDMAQTSSHGAGKEREDGVKHGKKTKGTGCFVCGQEGHKSFDCPQKQAGNKRQKKAQKQ